ncbi:MAG TPA: sodium:solute symporter [Flavobacteriales bacterium]|nr:sodium:solute symporter [Flavobacteriales bacterium]
MSPLDWTVLIATLLAIVLYGTWKNRRANDAENYLHGGHADRWWAVGFNVVATQLSAVTFISTTGQGFTDGMRFVQFYFGLPLAMIVISAVFIPLYYKWNVVTAYEFIGKRFDGRMRVFTAGLFLIQRSMAAGITIYAPSIILSAVLGIPFGYTYLITGFVVLYTTIGGAKAVSATQTQQMAVIFFGLIVILFTVLHKLGEPMASGAAGPGFLESLRLAGAAGRMNVITTEFNPNDKFTLWSGLLGGFFLQLAYFGTDQSQVGRYLNGRSARDAKLGLLFNGLVKIPMQFIVLLTGVLVFVFYLFHQSPAHWNEANWNTLRRTGTTSVMEAKHEQSIADLSFDASALLTAIRADDNMAISTARDDLRASMRADSTLRASVRKQVAAAVPNSDGKDADHIFLRFAVDHLPHGIIGLLIAVMLCASMSTSSAELNALASTTVLDVVRTGDPTTQVRRTRWATLAYGALAMLFAASIASWFGNLITAVNEIGSLFYGTVLGIFLVAFFFKHVHGPAVFWSAIIAEATIITLYVLQKVGGIGEIGFLWYNLIAPGIVVGAALLFQRFGKTPVPVPLEPSLSQD